MIGRLLLSAALLPAVAQGWAGAAENEIQSAAQPAAKRRLNEPANNVWKPNSTSCKISIWSISGSINDAVVLLKRTCEKLG